MSVEVLGFVPKEAGVQGWHLRKGNKELNLFIHTDSGVASSHIHNIPGKKEPGSTTRLHAAALNIMEDMASRKNRPIHYSFATSNPKMREWALGSGADIFGWDDVIEGYEELIANKTIEPNLSIFP